MNSYNAITAIDRTTNCRINLTVLGRSFTFSPPSLVTQYHPTTDTIIRYVTSFEKPCTGNSVLTTTSPITTLPVLRYSPTLTYRAYAVIDAIVIAQK